MTDTANHMDQEQGKFRRALAAIFAWVQAMEYTSFDYTLDRIERLEREVEQLKKELRQSRRYGPRRYLTTVAPMEVNKLPLPVPGTAAQELR